MSRSKDIVDNYRNMFESRISAGAVDKLPDSYASPVLSDFLEPLVPDAFYATSAPVTEFVTPLAATHTATASLSPVIEYVAPAPVIKYVAPAPADSYATLAPVKQASIL